MKSLQSYVLVLSQDFDSLQGLEFLLTQLRYTWVAVHSTAQAIAKMSQASPYLIILAGNQPSWSNPVHELRRRSDVRKTTIVALTDSYAPSWLYQEENPGLDGFLVKPLNRDVLTSVVQSAWARQTYGIAASYSVTHRTVDCCSASNATHAYSTRSEA